MNVRKYCFKSTNGLQIGSTALRDYGANEVLASKNPNVKFPKSTALCRICFAEFPIISFC